MATLTIQDYEAWKAKRQAQNAAAANVVLSTVDQQPDEVAADIQLGQQFSETTGNPQPPLPLVTEYRPLFQQQVEQARNSTILSRSPMLSDWLRNPQNAALARDDLEGLSWWETMFGAGRNAVGRGVMRLPQSYNQWMANEAARRFEDQDRSFGDILADETTIVPGSEGQPAIHSIIPGPDDLFFAGTRYLQSRLAPLLGSDNEAAALYYQQQAGQIAQQISAIPMSPAGERYKEAFLGLEPTGDMTADLGSFVTSVAGDPAGFLAFLTETAVESTPSLVAATAVTAATRSPTAGATFMGGYSFTVEAGTAPVEFFAEHNIDVSTPEGAAAALADPELMREAAQRGLMRGFIIGALDGLSGGLAGQQLAKSEIGNVVLQSIAQAAMGAAGEAGAQVASGQEFNLYDVIIEGLAEFVTAPLEVGGVGGRLFVDQQRSAREAEARRTLFEQLSGQAVNSTLRNRMPGAFQDFVARATENGPVENVYVPADQFVQYFQGIGIDPYELVGGLDGVRADDLDVALATGGDLQIPTATYAAHIAGSEHDAFLMENMRFDPAEFTSREAAEFNARARDALDEAYAEAERMRREDEQYRSFEQEIYETMLSRLRVAGRSTDVAQTEAMLYPAFYRVMAERSGLTVEEFMKNYPLPQVRGAVPQGMQARNVDVLNRTLAEARNRRTSGGSREQSLLEFISDRGGINDVGGELRARDAETVRRGRGKKTLRLARGGVMAGVRDIFGSNDGPRYGVDDVAQAAIEAGFMADDPVVQEYQNAMREGREIPDITRPLWDAIDRELRGEAERADGDVASGESDMLDTIEAYLAEIGMSLDDDDDAIRAAIDRDQQERGQEYGQSGDVRGSRGSIQFPGAGVGNGDTVISLFQTANLSTFVHESGHYFLTVMQDLAAKGEASSVQDFAAVKEWWRSNADAVAKDAMRVVPDVKITADDVIAALDGKVTGNVLHDGAIDVGMQEQFARAFEAYLLEGKAPSADLRAAFEKFRAWLISIYRKLSGLNVMPSDELRVVFDRMLATDREIAEAQAEAGNRGPLFATAEEMGLSPEDYAAFVKLYDQAGDEAAAKMLAEAMAPIRREREKWYRDERAATRENVEREVNGYRQYRAIEWMGNRRWLGDGQPEALPDVRLSKDILVDRYGEGVLKTLPRGRQTIYAVDGGMDPDDAAGLFGFASGDEMVRALEQAPPRRKAIEDQTDRVMFERHGDVMRDGTMEAAALDAVHADKRGQALSNELKALAEISGLDRGLTHKEAREIARQTLSRSKVRDAMNANRYLTAERKAGEEAQRLAQAVTRTGMWMDAARRRVAVKARAAVRDDDGRAALSINDQTELANARTGRHNENVAKLVEAKRRQLLNHMLYSESRRVADEVEAAERLVARLGKKSTRDKLAGDYLEAIDELLDRYDFRRMSGKAEDRRGALVAYIERMKADGRENELAIPESVLNDAKRVPYKSIPVEHLRGVVDSLKNIEHTARLKQKLIDAKAQRDLDAVVEDITAAFDANLPKRPPGRVNTTSEQRRNKVRQFLDLVLNAGTILREIDGFEDFGAAYRNIKGPIDEAMNRLQVRRRNAAVSIEKLYEVYSSDERRRMAVREHVPALGYSLSKWERIAVALNTGNEGNFQRLVAKNVNGSFTEAQVRAVLSTLDERDARFVQSVWDFLESFRPDIEAREKRATGVAPKWVEGRPVEIAGLTLKGGYYPLRYDPRLTALSRDDQAQDIAASLQAGRFGKAQTRNGHLKERASASGRAVELDIAVMHKHVNQVIYDLELSEDVANSWRILQDGRVRDAFIQSGKQADFDALETWLKDVAEGELRSADWVGQAARRFKSNFTAAKLAFNLSTVAVQLTGVAQSMVVVGKKDFLKGVTAMTRPGALDDITAKSQFMADRQTTFNKDVYDFYNDPKIGPTASRWTEIKQNVIGPLSFWLMTKVQYYAVDAPTWLAAYNQGLRRFGNSEAKAIAHADAIVKRSQASGLFSDRSAVERGSVSRTTRQNDVIRLFTALGSYMFAKFNVAYERSAKAGRTISQEGVSLKSAQEALSWTVDMAFLFTVEAVLYAAIKGRLPDDDDDDDDGWAMFLARETAFSVLSTIPFVRDISSSMSGFAGGGSYGAITEELSKPFIQGAQGEIDRAFVKSVINATGLVTGIPSTQINRAVDAGWRQAEGDDVSPVEYVLGRMGK